MLWYITHTVIIIKWHHTNDLMAKLHGSSYSINVMQKQMMSCHSHMTSFWLKLGGPEESMREIISSAVSVALSRSLPVAQGSESPAERKQSKKRKSPSIVPSALFLHDWGWHAWGDFFCSNSLFANTAQEKATGEKRTATELEPNRTLATKAISPSRKFFVSHCLMYRS